jgi:hypothetical protein
LRSVIDMFLLLFDTCPTTQRLEPGLSFGAALLIRNNMAETTETHPHFHIAGFERVRAYI